MKREPDQPPTQMPANNPSERALRGLARSLGASAAHEWFRLLLAAKDPTIGSTGDPPPRQ